MSATDTLGILAGQGALPAKLVQHCQAQNRPCFVLAFENNVSDELLQGVPHAVIRFSAISEGLAHLRSAGVKQLVMAGNMKRPPITQLKPEDATGAKLLKRLGKAIFGGDDALLRALIAFLEEEGFEVVGMDKILGGLSLTEGSLSRIKPDAAQREDITTGFKHLASIGACDIGQALVIENGYVLGVEAAEGTDALITRSAPLMKDARKAILVKGKKPGQELRADMPTIGTKTIELLAVNGYAGIAIEANHTLVADAKEVKALADKYGIFVHAHKVGV